MKPISVGDLVQVIAPWRCCGFTMGMGSVEVVQAIVKHRGSCGQCGNVPEGPAAEMGNGQCLLYRLKRIPPLDELDDVKRDEEITA